MILTKFDRKRQFGKETTVLKTNDVEKPTKKEKYVSPEIDIFIFRQQDIITTSIMLPDDENDEISDKYFSGKIYFDN